MSRTVRALALCTLLLALSAPVLAADGPMAKVADLGWMTGSWEGAMGQGGTINENWIMPESGTMAALVRATNGGMTSMIEVIVIEEKEGTLTLRLQQFSAAFEPRSPSPQVMRLVESMPNKVVFEATAEGGLKKLGYSRPADDQFVISVTTAQGAFDIPLKAK